MTFDTAHPFVLTASCGSRMGTTARVTTFLADRRLYIMEMQQFDDTLSGRFFVRVTFCGVAGETLDVAQLRQDFTAVAKVEEMDWAIHDTANRTRVMILVSNFDHCLEDLLYRHRMGELPMEVTGIASNHATLRPVAERYGVPFTHLPITADTKPQQEAALLKLVADTKTDLVLLARYMQILSDDLCRELSGRAINIHHSFLPGFKGARPYHQAHRRGVKLIGATAHYVTADLDEGPIIEQDVERISHSDTPEDLIRKGRDIERRVLARAVLWHVQGRVLLNGSKTVVFPA
jgi:formyltetrahydrofolate deformylase